MLLATVLLAILRPSSPFSLGSQLAMRAMGFVLVAICYVGLRPLAVLAREGLRLRGTIVDYKVKQSRNGTLFWPIVRIEDPPFAGRQFTSRTTLYLWFRFRHPPGSPCSVLAHPTREVFELNRREGDTSPWHSARSPGWSRSSCPRRWRGSRAEWRRHACAWPYFSRAPEPWPAIGGKWSSMMNRVVRSPSVPIAELPGPRIRSPSLWPGTARSATSAGSSLIMTSEVTKLLPRPRVQARGNHNARPCAQTGGQIGAQCSSALDMERLVDGLVADALGLVAWEIKPQAAGDLLRAPGSGPSSVLPRTVLAALPWHNRINDCRAAWCADHASQPVLNCPRCVALTAGLGRRADRSACHWVVAAR